MKRIATIVALLLLAGADRPPVNNSPPPTPAPSMFDRPAPPSVWQQIQGPLNRSTGRIVDEPSYQLYRIRRTQDEQLGRVPVQTEGERFREERERQLRLDQRAVQRQNESLRDQTEAVPPINPEQTTTTLDPSPIAAQAMADELALSRLRNTRDKQLTAANNQRLAALRQRPEERDQISAEYQKQLNQIEEQFQKQRNAILGFGPTPTTQP